MKRIYFGLIMLGVLMVFPLSGALVNGWNDIHPLPAPALVPLLKIVSAFLVGAIGAHLFTVMSGLKGRLAKQPPGANVMLAGALLAFGFPACLAALIYWNVAPAFLRFLPMNGLTQYPAYIVLLVGAFRVMLHLEPSKTIA